MGCELAQKAAYYGASVDLILGPSSQVVTHPFINVYRIENAQQMFIECDKRFSNCDIAILSAAVADFTPKSVATQKIKKNKDILTIELAKTKDILTSLSKIKDHQFLVGFALETQNELENAKTKLKKKNLDLIVLNSLNDEGAGFQHDTNKVTLISKDNKVTPYGVKPKSEVGRDILNYIIREIYV